MQKRSAIVVPESVRVARLSGNFTELSRLGKKGNKTIREKKIKKFLLGSDEMARQANEDICPVN